MAASESIRADSGGIIGPSATPLDAQGCTAFRIDSLQVTTKGVMDRLGHPMGAMGAGKGEQDLAIGLVWIDGHEALEGMFGADMGLSIVNQGQDLTILLRPKGAAQAEFSGWHPIADAGTGGTTVVLGSGAWRGPTPVTLVIAGLAVRTGCRLGKFAVEPIGIGLIILGQALAAGRMLTWRMGCLAAHGNLNDRPLFRQALVS